MDENEIRLANCFVAIFPELTSDEIVTASTTSVQAWDSVANVTLLAVVEEEFGISMDVDDLSRFDSFKKILSYLRDPAATTVQ